MAMASLLSIRNSSTNLLLRRTDIELPEGEKRYMITVCEGMYRGNYDIIWQRRLFRDHSIANWSRAEWSLLFQRVPKGVCSSHEGSFVRGGSL